jgi:peptidoglycan/xylan/chitin deacetylase (PgdA/CDA1 family)
VRGSIATHLARRLGRWLPTRPLPVTWPGGVVSFTFDDFPKSAFTAGAAILEEHGARGTYYVALDLAETENDLGRMFDLDDVRAAHQRGHELACHTFRHVDCSRIGTEDLLADIADNHAVLARAVEGFAPDNFAFPFGGISLASKRLLSRHFASCRGISEGINAGTADFADLKACRVQDFADADGSLRRLIDAARAIDGWLIFYTHDVRETPSRYGCTPEQLDAVVAYAAETGTVLPVRDVVAGLGHGGSDQRQPEMRKRTSGEPAISWMASSPGQRAPCTATASRSKAAASQCTGTTAAR